MSLETARGAFLDMMQRAQWTENADADLTPGGGYLNRTTHTLIVSDRDLAVLADALGLDCRIYETPQASIRRHMSAGRDATQSAAE